MKDYIILGFQKCGQTALSAYLNCKVDELIYYPDAIERYKSHYLNHRPVFILRDPLERLWSEYHYFEHYREEMSFREFLTHRSDKADRGFTTPIERTDYWRWIEPFRAFHPLILNLSDMQTLMPAMNVNQHIKRSPGALDELIFHLAKREYNNQALKEGVQNNEFGTMD